MSLSPLTFAPVVKAYRWGGRKLGELLGRDVPAGRVAESWEISAHPNGPTPVLGGAAAGTLLADLQLRYGEALIGSRNGYALELGRFPLLIKLLDAHEWLSVQVHPRDDGSREGFGKTEMWVVLQADPGSELLLGLDSAVDEETLRGAIAKNRLVDHLQRLPVSAGDVFFVPAGTVHALGPGLLLAEIQQSSDTTYRLYDWDRNPDDSPPRPLHIDQSLGALDYSAIRPAAVRPLTRREPGLTIETLASCRYFQTERLRLERGKGYSGACEGATMEIWGVLEGSVTVHWWGREPIERRAVQWCLLPADLGAYEVRATEPSTLLRVITPEAS